MKASSLFLCLLTLALAGCIGRSNKDDSKSSSSEVSANSSSEVVVSSSSSDVPESSSSLSIESSSSVMVVSSSSVASSSSVQSSSEVSSSSEVNSSSEISSSSEVASSSESSASSSVVNIEDLNFTDTVDSDQSIQTDSIENLGSALIGLVDQEAYSEFYYGLIAQGLDEAAVAKALSVLGIIANAVGADFIQAFSGQALLPAPPGVNVQRLVTPVGDFGIQYGYTINQPINDVDVILDAALRFEDRQPAANALIGRPGYNVFLDGLKLVINTLTLTTSDVTIVIQPANPLLAANGVLNAQVELAVDGSSIVAVNFRGQNLTLDLRTTIVNGIIGAEGDASGTIDAVNSTLDLVNGQTTLNVTSPDVTVNAQGLDTSGN